MKYRKKPVVIEAVKASDVLDAAGTRAWESLPSWIRTAWERGVIVLNCPDTVEIFTLEGQMTAQRPYQIIQGVRGELYPCKPDIFAATYEPAE